MTCTLHTLAEVFSGDMPLKLALSTGKLQTDGLPKFTRGVQGWLRTSRFANTPLPGPRLVVAR